MIKPACVYALSTAYDVFCSVNVKSLISFKEELSLEMCVLSDMGEEVIQMLGSSIILIYIILCKSVNLHLASCYFILNE